MLSAMHRVGRCSKPLGFGRGENRKSLSLASPGRAAQTLDHEKRDRDRDSKCWHHSAYDTPTGEFRVPLPSNFIRTTKEFDPYPYPTLWAFNLDRMKIRKRCKVEHILLADIFAAADAVPTTTVSVKTALTTAKHDGEAC